MSIGILYRNSIQVYPEYSDHMKNGFPALGMPTPWGGGPKIQVHLKQVFSGP